VPTGSSVAYLDASALIKLVVAEPESPALRRALQAWPRRVTSRVAVVELIRSVRRIDPRLEPRARRTLAGVVLLALNDRVLVTAAQLEPPGVRALDAIHVASSLRLRTVVGAFVSYDRRQLEGAAAAGLPVVTPS
jgi:predicted nucleic acid-binding protein